MFKQSKTEKDFFRISSGTNLSPITDSLLPIQPAATIEGKQHDYFSLKSVSSGFSKNTTKMIQATVLRIDKASFCF